MKFLFPASSSRQDQTQSRLLSFAAAFVFLFSVLLTLSPAVRYHSWDVAYRWEHWIGFGVWLAAFTFLARRVNRLLPEHDPYLLPLAALLTGWGLLTIWRLDLDFGLRQTLWLAVCTAVVGLGLRYPHLLTLLRRYKYIWLVGGLLLTILTFFFGTYPGGNGPHLWLGCCGVYLQPSEPLKLLMVVYLAAYLADHLPLRFSLLQLLAPTMVLLVISLVVLFVQRDLGTTSLFIILYTMVIYLASGKRRVLLISFAVLVAAGVAGYQWFDVIRIRVDAWLNPWVDPSGRSYQIVQSLLAVASGGLFGTGPGLGSPGVVPVAQSDFIFAAISEETGLIGTLGLFAIFSLLAVRSLLVAVRASSSYQRYLAAGLTIYLIVQSLLIMGGNLRLLPLTGVTLPFLSYGGSSLVTAFGSLLLLLIISGHGSSEEEPAALGISQPFRLAGGLLLAGFCALAILNGYWAYIQSESLQSRADNPRRVIADRFVRRGSLLDRHNTPLVMTTGSPGNFSRPVLYPPLSNTLGYNQAAYGQSGLEAGLDPYLRGLQGNPSSMIWSSNLLYAQPPPGLDIRLSIDLTFQRRADELMAGKNGALVLLNARTGEILALASHPYYDANQLATQWTELVVDQRGLLINRATQGQYPVGTAVGPFMLAEVLNNNALPLAPEALSYRTSDGNYWPCILTPSSFQWGPAIAAGCPGPIFDLYDRLPKDSLALFYKQLGFFETPSLPILQAGSPSLANQNFNVQNALLGINELNVTPLQMALAAASLSNNGIRPSPRLSIAVQTPNQGWVILPNDPSATALPLTGVTAAIDLLQDEQLPLWQSLGSAQTAASPITWYLAGTLPNWQGMPLALALVLEENNPTQAQEIGQKLLLVAESTTP